MTARQPLDSDWLWQQLQRYSPFRRAIVALSGGVDSTVLLHLCAQLSQQHQFPLAAIHINHQLQPPSDSWARQCAELCERWQIPICVEKVVVKKSGHGIESDARTARYQVFERQLQQGDILLQGHHADDQAETVIMRLVRGSGVHGMAAIPDQRSVGQGRVIRPLLAISRAQIVDYALQHKLSWVDDPGNLDLTIERNLIRHEVIPKMESQRSGVRQALVRSTEQFAESAGLLDQLAEMDLLAVQQQPRQLDCERLIALEHGRLRNLLRYWVTTSGFLAPSSAVIDRIIDEGLHSRGEAHPLITWFGAEVRRYRTTLYLMAPIAAEAVCTPVVWKISDPLSLGGGMGTLRAVATKGEGIRADLLGCGELTVRWRCGGERIQPAGRNGHHRLKNLFQESSIPPWQRDSYPLIYLDGELVSLPNLYTHAAVAAAADEPGISVEWIESSLIAR